MDAKTISANVVNEVGDKNEKRMKLFEHKQKNYEKKLKIKKLVIEKQKL